jgi:hypothetical protein
MDVFRFPRTTRTLGSLALAAFLFGAHPSWAEESDTGERIRDTQNVIADMVFARPFGLVQLVAGIAVFPVAYPAGWILGDSDFGPRVCVREPADRVFNKPLGEL